MSTSGILIKWPDFIGILTELQLLIPSVSMGSLIKADLSIFIVLAYKF